MRCLACHRLSWSTFCQSCQQRLLKPTITKRTINSLEVYSFFKYHDIEDLLLSKHTKQGFIVYRALAKLSFGLFIKNFIKHNKDKIYILGIDENVKYGYSHVAVLTHEMRYKNVKILHSKLMAKNPIKYAGKSLQFRLENPREFYYLGEKDIEVILVDDIITTGTTINEAKRVLEKNSVKTLFVLTLADVKV